MKAVIIEIPEFMDTEDLVEFQSIQQSMTIQEQEKEPVLYDCNDRPLTRSRKIGFRG
jgi:hypothetical protein